MNGTRFASGADRPEGPARAVVFAYHDVGVRCLRVLIDAGIDVALVVTHEDAPGERIWFRSVARTAAQCGVPCIMPADVAAPEVLALVAETRADFLFSFYYRQVLPAELLRTASRGAFNLHGSLLPRYRGRAPVNWAILNGERETGATLHVMQERPDAGPIVDQLAVPILGDDTAREVFDKVTVAAELLLVRTLPELVCGTARFREQDLARGSCFGRRRPEDGRIPAAATGRRIHDLVRAVAPPEYPGAFFDVGGRRVLVERTARPLPLDAGPRRAFTLMPRNGALWLDAVDGTSLRVLSAALDGEELGPHNWDQRAGAAVLAPDPPLPEPAHRAMS